MLETGSSQIVTQACPQSTPVDAQARGVQSSPICTAQLVIAEAALATPNGGGVRWLLVPGRGGGQRSVMTLAVIKAAASEAR